MLIYTVHTLWIKSSDRVLESAEGELRVDEAAEFGGSLVSMPLSCFSHFSNLAVADDSVPAALSWVASLIGLSQALTAGAGAGTGMLDMLYEAVAAVGLPANRTNVLVFIWSQKQ